MSPPGPPDDVVVRPIEPGEHEAVAAMTIAVYADVLKEVLTPEYRAELADVARRAAEAVVLVAVDGDSRLRGSVTFVPSPESRYAEFSGEHEAGIRMLVVAPEAQRRGVGTRLVEACIDRARAAGLTQVSLHTTPSMTVAQRLYERLGFVRAPGRDWVPEPGVHLLGYVLPLC